MQKPKKFAVSHGDHAPGVICIDSDGVITYDPRSPGPESLIRLKTILGYKPVALEKLMAELKSDGIHLRGPDKPEHLSISEAQQWDLYCSGCVKLGAKLQEAVAA